MILNQSTYGKGKNTHIQIFFFLNVYLFLVWLLAHLWYLAYYLSPPSGLAYLFESLQVSCLNRGFSQTLLCEQDERRGEIFVKDNKPIHTHTHHLCYNKQSHALVSTILFDTETILYNTVFYQLLEIGWTVSVPFTLIQYWKKLTKQQ